MLIDTHCHINLMVKNNFDIPLQLSDLPKIKEIIAQAKNNDVSLILNIGSNHSDNQDSLMLAQAFDSIFITVGLHPNDGIKEWKTNLNEIKQWLQNKEQHKIVGIGECGLDMHYPDYNLNEQRDAFKAQIEVALEHDLALVVHSRDAYDETLRILEEYKKNLSHVVMHCFSYDQTFAKTVTDWNFLLGVGGTITYPKNNELRAVVVSTNLKNIVLETDAPFLPPQTIRGKQNHPKEIATIAHFIANLRGESFESIAQQTTENALTLFGLPFDTPYFVKTS
ncbi:MAG TPA: TatD family hydrolase [Patescibacteria group bacterium]|nr:TatD family hydrolase [Patescibacteria group bacterium]